jgi:1-deoxy-D-xylulose-5-phosphate reductoisomerase
MKRLAVLGSTGSIGTSTLDLVRSYPDRFRVIALAAGRNLTTLRRQIVENQPVLVSVASKADAEALAEEFPEIEVSSGAEGLHRAACHHSVDMVVSALVGAVGLTPTVAAIRAGKDIALANKETLVIAGELVMAEVRKAEVQLLPVDSEHCALHQILNARPPDAVSRLVLTASGGPFRTWTGSRMERATIDEALAHPTWRMGPKISVDSATMMNKGFEIIEAHHLFAMPADRIDVVIHPQSLVHSLVEFTDGTLLAQLSVNDMRSPILAALSWPERPASPVGTLDLAAVGRLDFSAPDHDRFPALDLARAALQSGGEMPAVLNAANEVAVEAFLAGGCPFHRIAATIDAVMENWHSSTHSLTSIEQAIQTDAEARRLATAALGNTTTRSRVQVS